ncbi:3-deoxy-manno-octulosonate cytidylyltransferase [Schleiferia thermophila]|jgi:3-deoxy-manno-octulosonate cytidylyltransferase (CMP-KDO synthetase)|uniref:3-deoxy-manno-octulosonate cytidylyltransferase n=1 Tax=Schleiferia thermophila TaxID=884107 RepID=A0A369A240_9FLAO|nr:3-deoxy-manno-octulosonate cytidylyltransferase [Schleiferia thermophila]KFD39048.1 3-deoxy-manno-octulosonate cytidylyltransferase [Schleiferia thermophila str. Yellowstone]PMB28369.1 3-deoxy-manno-octulosonate cytidylyltransferase [Fischerella thermalis CCMEE 5319]RCX02426.1 3-deoxy-manno-octulosonate cytidylyltransferase (CMP-KDO synthetase) [Schleiferia thermophila]GCD80691.1 3-deoxy-manno-octulosonate cytidylyltransferase [Schleiferia thermophila]
MKTLGIIPARYASTRLPGKPLIDLAGKPMIQHVYERVLHSVDHLVVATDDQRIADRVAAFGGHAVITSPHHPNGTSRCNETLKILQNSGEHYDVVVNIQGDEPLIDPQLVQRLISAFSHSAVQIVTAIRSVTDPGELVEGPVCVVTDHSGRALYFSRSVIPFVRDLPRHLWLQAYPFNHHIGIYAFRTTILSHLVNLPESPLEAAEKLEQLRWLYAGYHIHCISTTFQSIPVDTPEDVLKVRKLLTQCL